MPDKQHLYKQSVKSPPCWEVFKEANYFIAFEITLMQRAMIQASYIMLTRVISLLLTLVLGSDSCNNNDTTLVA